MKRKHRITTLGWIIMIVVCLGIGALGAFLLFGKKDDQGIASTTPTVETTTEPTEEAPVVTQASMFMVGDALLHTTIPFAASTGNGTYDFTNELHRIGEIAEPYDLQYYNQETILGGDELGLHGYPTFNGPQAWGDAMVNYGFNLVSQANNHSLDMGVTGLTNSVNYWNSKEGVVTSGTYLSQEDREAIKIHEINGISYAFFSWTYGMNGFQNPEDAPYMVACYEGHEDEMLNQIAEAKKQADVVIVAMHWGTEYVMDATDEQRTLAQKVADAGADIIIGNHPHVIGPIEWLNDHKTICFYALGNVCAAQFDPSRIEMMAALNIVKTTQNGESTIEIKDVKADLMYQYTDWDNFDYFEIVPFAQMTDDTYVADHESVYEEYKQVITKLDSSIQVGGF